MSCLNFQQYCTTDWKPPQVLYSRLYLFKTLTREMADRPNDPFEPNLASIKMSIPQADLAKIGDKLDHASHFYDLMLESCEKLFDNELEPQAFEEMMRFMFGLKVCTVAVLLLRDLRLTFSR